MSAQFPERIIVCEGMEDVHFFKMIMSVHSMHNFKVMDTSTDSDRTGGISKFKGKLNSLKTKYNRTFSGLRHLVVVADNDDDPVGNFQNVKNQVDLVFPGKAPSQAWEKIGTSPSISILMLPFVMKLGKPVPCDGNLEGFCENIARKDTKSASHIDCLLRDVNVTSWAATRRGKAWLRSNLAIRAKDPCAPLGEIFRDQSHLFDLRDQSLTPIIQHLLSLV